jgi:hypothetical protein
MSFRSEIAMFGNECYGSKISKSELIKVTIGIAE